MLGFGMTDKGLIRSENQDTYLFEYFEDKDIALCIVCDGMGGVRGGGLASQIASASFVAHIRTCLSSKVKKELPAILLEAADYANQKVYRRSRLDSNCRGMGTTLVGALIYGSELIIINIGDSRGYLVTDKKIRQITRDHSLVEDMVRRGELTTAQAKSHPRKNLITRALGVDIKARCDIFTHTVKSGDYLILCSDGLSNQVADEEMLTIVSSETDLEIICKRLLDLTLMRGAPDNVTVVILEL